MHTVIDCKYLNPAKENKKYGSVVDVGGDRYACPAALVASFRPGQRYQCQVVERTWGSDQVRVIERVLPYAAVPPNGTNGISTGTVPSKTNGNGHKDEQLFVLALAKSFIESGRVVDTSPDELVKLIESLRSVYARTFGR